MTHWHYTFNCITLSWCTTKYTRNIYRKKLFLESISNVAGQVGYLIIILVCRDLFFFFNFDSGSVQKKENLQTFRIILVPGQDSKSTTLVSPNAVRIRCRRTGPVVQIDFYSSGLYYTREERCLLVLLCSAVLVPLLTTKNRQPSLPPGTEEALTRWLLA